MEWSDRTQVKKGDLAENIVHSFLEDKGFIVYSPETNGPHAFDRLAVKGKKQLIIAEVKAKARMNYYRATGINVRNYNEYKLINAKHNIPVFLFFVDEGLGLLYGNWLSELEKESHDDLDYPNTKISPGIILFSYAKMITIQKLSIDEIEILKKYSTRNYQYKLKST